MARLAAKHSLQHPLVESRVYETEPDWHEHDYCQLLFGLSGQSEVEMGGQLFHTNAASAVIIPAGVRHDFLGDDENRQLVIDLPACTVAIPHRLLDKPFEFAIPNALGRLLQQTKATRSPQTNWALSVRVADQVVQLLGGKQNDATYFPVRQIDAYLRQHLATPLSTSQLSEQFGWKARRFHDLFCEAFGDTPQRYQHRLRLDFALSLLSKHTESLTDIANTLGYADQPAFTRHFSARFGTPPGKWRGALLSDIHHPHTN
ncbi:AraC family transcriptional regulator [Leeia sp. TBRC 13508]|uniref:AraC family transcriptional regulator n=1 Tax=Leeia speluncae TaxID=2884804 RepID=A0ABS8D4H0_9NEIS|nr:AraC family transcriptional regulator [Leeia speluncae]MCB6183077.1 AraC family transcriptional regulator [Leeia speluncae]